MPAVSKKLIERTPLIMAMLVFVFGCLVVGLAVCYQRTQNQIALQERFDVEAKKLADTLISHIRSYENALLGIRGMIVSHDDDKITRSAFKSYYMSRNMDQEFSGAMGFGFIRRITRENEADFLIKARQDDMPDFTIKEFAPHEGERYIVQYIEPAGRNRTAIGLDIASENTRRKAAQEAMRTGLTIMTAPITLIQTSGKPLRSFLLLLPVYHLSMSLLSAEQREAETFGWSYMPIGIEDVLNQQTSDDSEIAMQIADSSANEQTIFYTNPDFEDAAKALNTTKINRTIFGRSWQFELRALPLFYQYHKQISLVWLAGIGTFCSLLLSVSLYLYLSNRQRTLQDSIEQRRLATIVESVNDPILSLDLNGVITSWNRAAVVMFDFTAREAIGRKICELIIPDELIPTREEFLRKIRHGEDIPRHDSIRKTRDGRLIDVSVLFSHIRDKNGEIIGVANSLIDITERKRSQEMFQMTLESIPDAIITVDHESRITLVNQQALQLVGYERTELLGQHLSLVIPPRYRNQHLLHTHDYLAQPQPLVREMGKNLSLFILCKDGIEVPVEIKLSSIQTANEKFTLASIADIRQRKELQAEVQTTLARMKMAFNALNIGIWVWRLDNNELIWDDRMIEIYQPPASLHKSKINYDFWVYRLHPEDRMKTESLIMGYLAGENSYDTDFRIVLDTGDIRYIKASAILERDQNAKPIQMVGVNFDITDIKTSEIRIKEINASLEQQVEIRTAELNQALVIAKQANNAKTDFLANMSHEIRTPINAIIGLAYLLKKQEFDTAARDMIGNIDNAGHSLLNVINECLDFSKIEANQLDIEVVPFHLSDVLDCVANIMASNAVQKKSVELCIAPVPKRANYLLGDPVRLEQVLVNLVSNAIKFTEVGEVIVEVRIIDSILSKNRIYLHFSVRDTGIGISPEKLESIFKPFTQADNSTTRLYGGTGLGLTISRRLVELMGGTLQLKSQVGVGSEFFFDLILSVSNTPDNLPSVLPYQNVLIADDNNVALKFLRSMVISLGWNATMVDSGETLLQKIVEKGIKHFDLLLLDWNLSDIDGIELVHGIRDQCGSEVCPIIIMISSFDRAVLAAQHLNELVDGIICKPVTSSSLFNAVLKVKEQRNELENNNHQLASTNRLVGLNLLVVDDSEINREVACQILKGEGANVEVAENGAVAIMQLKARPDYFHLVLMDVQMPVMDGYAATQAIREIPELSHLPIIALTAGAFKSQRDLALEMGMDDFVAKPFDVNELVACILRLVKRRQNGKTSLLTPETVAPIQAITFDELPLFDIEQGLKKWNTVEFYQKYLRSFLQQHAQDAEHIHHEYQKDDTIAAMVIIHKLVGVAGALSLKRVARFAADIEAALNKQLDAEELILRFAPILSQTIDAINVYLKSESQPQSEQINFQTMSNSVLTELEQLIESLNSNNLELIEPLLFALSGKLPKQQFDKILSAVETFDFREARIIAKTLVAEIANNKKE